MSNETRKETWGGNYFCFSHFMQFTLVMHVSFCSRSVLLVSAGHMSCFYWCIVFDSLLKTAKFNYIVAPYFLILCLQKKYS